MLAVTRAPAGLDDALALVDAVDDTLVQGLARLGDSAAAALDALGGAFAATPVAGRVADAVGKIAAGTVTDEYLAAVAGARSALLGAAHDALLGCLDRPPAAAAPAAAGTRERSGTREAPPDGTRELPALAGARSWLRELAIAGWRGVDHELASGGAPAIRALLPDPAGRRLAVLLDGLAAELRCAAPVATFDPLPTRRWADLWTRAVLLAQRPWAGPATEPVDGRLLLLGVDLHEHPTVFRAQVHGVLEADGAARLVRASVAAPKVDTISGASAWRLLGAYPILRTALAGHRAVEVRGMHLTAGGDLLWDEAAATAGEPADPFATARVLLGTATAAPRPPLDRHPMTLAEPVLLEGYTVDGGELDLGGGARVALDTGRLPAAGPLTVALVAASTACIGLLRFDGRWAVQPLGVLATVKKKQVAVHTADWALGPADAKAAKAEAAAGTAVDVLRERAGRLLRR